MFFLSVSHYVFFDALKAELQDAKSPCHNTQEMLKRCWTCPGSAVLTMSAYEIPLTISQIFSHDKDLLHIFIEITALHIHPVELRPANCAVGWCSHFLFLSSCERMIPKPQNWKGEVMGHDLLFCKENIISTAQVLQEKQHPVAVQAMWHFSVSTSLCPDCCCSLNEINGIIRSRLP